jgi:hypothetical protein
MTGKDVARAIKQAVQDRSGEGESGWGLMLTYRTGVD